MYRVLVVLGYLIAFAGLLQLSQATLGVGIIALACFTLIHARIVQASYFNKRN